MGVDGPEQESKDDQDQYIYIRPTTLFDERNTGSGMTTLD